MFISFLYSLVVILYMESEYIFYSLPPLTLKVFQPSRRNVEFFKYFSL